MLLKPSPARVHGNHNVSKAVARRREREEDEQEAQAGRPTRRRRLNREKDDLQTLSKVLLGSS